MLAPAISATAEPWKRHTIDKSSKGADGVRLMDVNGDGLLDVATGWEEGGVVRAYINPGPKKSKAEWPAVTVGRVKSAEDAVFFDVDKDGAIDVVSCCEGGVRVDPRARPLWPVRPIPPRTVQSYDRRPAGV